MKTFNMEQALNLVRKLGFDYGLININDNAPEYIGVIYKNNDEMVGYIRKSNRGIIIQFDENGYSVTIDQITSEGAIGTIITQDLENKIRYKYDFEKQLHLFRLINPKIDILVSLSPNGITIRDGEKITKLNIDGVGNKSYALQHLRTEIPVLLCEQVKLRK
jgi:hypothetical protein